jgi:hypothetical protein
MTAALIFTHLPVNKELQCEPPKRIVHRYRSLVSGGLHPSNEVARRFCKPQPLHTLAQICADLSGHSAASRPSATAAPRNRTGGLPRRGFNILTRRTRSLSFRVCP